MNTAYDVIVLGLGAMGSAAAHQLARRGKKVLGLERFQPGHEQGSSHGQSRIIRQAYYEDPAYVPLLLRAYELWWELERAAGAELLRITGGLMIGEGSSQVVDGSIRSAREHNLAYDILDAATIRRRFPALTPGSTSIALYEELGGVLFPERAIAAQLAQAAVHGATLRFDEPAARWSVSADSASVHVTTAVATYNAERLVICAGAWAPDLLRDLGLPLQVKRNVLYWFAPTGGRAPFLPERCPIYIWESENDMSFYGFPALPGTPDGVKVAFHNFGPYCTPETVDRTVYPAEVARMRAWLAERIPALAQGELVATKTCLYTLTPDMDFLIGLHPTHPQVTLISPCSGHGFKFASVVGEIAADLAIDGRTSHLIDRFAPSRFG